MSSCQAGYVRGRYFTTYVEEVKLLTKSDQLAEAEQLLRELVDATERQACVEGLGVAPWYYEQLAIIYRKQKRYDAEVGILRRYAEAPKAVGSKKAQLAQRLKIALLLLEEAGPGPKLQTFRAERSRTRRVTVESNFGPVTMDNPYGRPLAMIALGQSEEHIRWYFDVHRKASLRLARWHRGQIVRGIRSRSEFDDEYVHFIEAAEGLMKTLPQDRDAAIEANRATIEGRHVRVVATFDSWEEADRSAKYMSKKFERTLNAGWNLQIIAFQEHF